ncbi:serine hydrolase domain-containing protein [Cognatilysobacter bugurensis]|uniref:serine hydrolase domain-containing protein n=1 Tax=Cognatilysobacter bugurensis TaxID=543356 RepID=UPI0027E583B0|nr:serine hydrolase domain-containing protein [Lysobacter bugurensis]
MTSSHVERITATLLAACLLVSTAPALCGETSSPAVVESQIDIELQRAMAATGANAIAMAVVEDGHVTHVASRGRRNAAGDPLLTDTVMYGASLTKAAFAYMVMQLVDEELIELDRPISEYLDRPLPDYPDDPRYGPWSNLADDPRWRSLTPRMLLNHSAGFANFAWLEPDGKLRIHFEPGSRYAYSGEGYILLQFVLERGLGLDVGKEMQRRVFDRFGMTNTGMTWRPDFADNLADGWSIDGAPEPHDPRSKVRAAGSMDTTIQDMARFAAGYIRGEGLTPQAHAALFRAPLPIATDRQFPTLQSELPAAKRCENLASGLGVEVFDGPQGPGFIRGGHNEITGNVWVCLQRGRRCVVILSNDVRAEAAFPRLVESVLGETGAPWRWKYGAMTFWR